MKMHSRSAPISTRAAVEAMPEGAICVIDALGVTDAGLALTRFAELPGAPPRRVGYRLREGTLEYLVWPSPGAGAAQGAAHPVLGGDMRAQLREQIDELVKIVEPIVLPRRADDDHINELAFYLDIDLYERQSLLDQDGIIARARAMIELLTMKAANKR